MRRPSRFRAAAWLLPLLLAGCLVSRDTKNAPLDQQLVGRLEPGTTTARDVVEMLGAPTEVVQLGHRSAYRYDYTTTKEMGMLAVVVIFTNKDTRSDRLWVFFDENEVMTHFGKTFAAGDTRYAMPWEDIPGAEETE